MSEFKRNFNEKLIKDLKETQLFQKLYVDVKNGKVFPSIRNNTINFYYEGCSLFKYDNKGFSTIYKYLINNDKEKDKYIFGDGSSSCKVSSQGFIVDNFVDGYKSIKQTIRDCYAKPEAVLTTGFYDFSFFKDGDKNDYVLLEIEAAFEKLTKKESEKRRGTDRIDVVLFNKIKKQIIFCEVKKFNDSRIFSKKGESAEVVGQLKRYEEQINQGKDRIIDCYNQAFACYSELFETPKCTVESIYPQAVLFVCGCEPEKYEKIAKKEVDKIAEETGYKTFFSSEVKKGVLIDIINSCT